MSSQVDSIRKLLLGCLYYECKNNPTSVTKDRLMRQYNKVKCSSCANDCSFDEFVDLCELRSASFTPPCVKKTREPCLAKYVQNNLNDANIESLVYQDYLNGKRFSPVKLLKHYRPSTPSIEEEDDCVLCQSYFYVNQNSDVTAEEPTQMSCGHYAHGSCLRDALRTQRKTDCPICGKQLLAKIRTSMSPIVAAQRPVVYLGGKPVTDVFEEAEDKQPLLRPTVYLGGAPIRHQQDKQFKPLLLRTASKMKTILSEVAAK